LAWGGTTFLATAAALLSSEQIMPKLVKNPLGYFNRDRNLSKHREPVWDGPQADGPKGGVTQGLLSRWLCCRERFRLRVVEGLAPVDTFNHRLEYGQMWHVCEECLAHADWDWEKHLKNYAMVLCKQYPLQQEQVQHWYNVCKTQFPLYVKYWAKHPDVKDRTPLLQEQVFDVPYKLPSSRVVRLRGKWDSVDLIGKGKTAAAYLQENKSKGDIDEQQLKRQLGFDLQTMIYRIAMDCSPASLWQEKHVAGVRYNVVRRPLSGGKGSIVQGKGTKGSKCSRCKGTGRDKLERTERCDKCGGVGRVGAKPPETDAEYYARLAEVIMEDPGYYFMRWKVEVTPDDVRRFKHEFLDNALEELCNWWGWVSSPEGRKDPFGDPIHYRLPYGIYNVLAEGGSSEVDEYLASGSELGLTKNNELFKELV
jgi:hypothetical protein